ncbi:MAG: D-aminoacyl-tRNA deacylase [Alcanivoracaceae bacterium]|nr:D-aminoacyl-tRNA deacylase [Alcanivoracaceae bacterium]
MKVLLQRVTRAAVRVSGEQVGAIDAGLLLFVGIERADDGAVAERLAARVAGYRVFADEQGRMNRDVRDVGGGVLAVSQFTLAADTSSGRRPGFSLAAPPEQAQPLFDHFVTSLRAAGIDPVATGRFGADMKVSLENDGPVTFLLSHQSM